MKFMLLNSVKLSLDFGPLLGNTLDKSSSIKELVFSWFYKAKPFNFFLLIQFSYLLLKKLGLNQSVQVTLCGICSSFSLQWIPSICAQ
jgi:hypothetical protein